MFEDRPNEAVIRPPAEAGSFILLVTRGCSHNGCTFCGAYRRRKFEVRPWEEVRAAIDEVAVATPETKRVFLADGNSMVLPVEQLTVILDYLDGKFPALARVGMYANAGDVLNKSDEQLRLLRRKKLATVYLGLESGNEEILRRVRKGSTAAAMTEAVRRLQAAGIRVSLIVLLGLGGVEMSVPHVEDSVRVINAMQPAMLNFLTLMLVPGTALWRAAEKGEFELPDEWTMLEELSGMVQGLRLSATVLRADHASNYLALRGRLPNDKARLLAEIDAALSGRAALRADIWRGL